MSDGTFDAPGRATSPQAPTTGRGKLYFNIVTKTFHQVDDVGADTDLTAGGGGGGQTDTVVGSAGISNVGTNVDADLAPTYGTATNTVCEGDDARLSDARAPTGTAGGDLGGTFPNPTVDDGADGTALHDDTAGEILAITLKGTPVNADLLLIEDSADSNAKKSITVGSLPTGGGGGWTVVTETTASRTAADGEFILVNAATCVITLPSPVADARVACKVITSTPTAIEIRTSGAGVDIDGTDYSSSGLVLASQYEQISMISDGTDWFIY